MKNLSFAIFCLVVLGGLNAAFAQTPNPFALDEKFSADLVISMAKEPILKERIYMDKGKLRLKAILKGLTIETLIRPDLKMGYQLLTGKHKMLQIPLNATEFKEEMFMDSQEGIITPLAPETAEGIPCDKFKILMINGDKGTYIFWRDSKSKSPVKIETPDQSFNIIWKHYKPGPQSASLFEVPSDYKVVKSPLTPNLEK